MIKQELDNGQTVDEMVKDLPLYEQLIVRGQMPSRHVVRNLIEVVRRQAHEIDCLQASEFREVEIHGQTIDERDRMHEVADTLAHGISNHFRVEIGEHSSMNCPWAEAGKILNGDFITDSDQDRELAELRKEKARLEWMIREEAIVEVCKGLSADLYSIAWPSIGESQSSFFKSPAEAIDAAMAVNS